MKAYLSEIFSSIQGEGPQVGERHLFLRFCGCHRSCIYCDTVVERTEAVRIEKVPGSGIFGQIPNPLAADQLLGIVREMDPSGTNRRIAITGGAPLLQVDFLCGLLPLLHAEGRNLYLETTGDLPRQLEAVIEWVDVVAMDVKLSSVTKEPNTFPAHWDFLKVCRAGEARVFAKLILSSETDETELMQAARGIGAAGGADTPVVIQPMSRAEKTDAVPTGGQLLRWQEMVAQVLADVRVIPQTHALMEVL